MKFLFAAAWACSVTLAATVAAAQQPVAPRPPPTPSTGELTPIPAHLKPPGLRASAIAVNDLPAMQRWYETVFGFVKIRDVSANEIVESLEPNNANAVNLILMRGKREPGAGSYGRLMINVNDAKATADFLQSHGVTTRQVIPNRAYFITDPEGNVIELFQAAPPTK